MFNHKIYYSFKEFEDEFENNFSEYMNTFKDANRSDFINHYLKEVESWVDNITILQTEDYKQFIKASFFGENCVSEIVKVITDEHNEIIEDKRLALEYTFDRIKEFLQKETNFLTELNPEEVNKTFLTWYGSDVELIELIKALIEAKKIRGTEKEIFREYTAFFGKEIDKAQKLQTIKKRKKDETRFLDNLKNSLENWIFNGEG